MLEASPSSGLHQTPSTLDRDADAPRGAHRLPRPSIPESFDLPLLLCHFVSSDPPAKLARFPLEIEGLFRACATDPVCVVDADGHGAHQQICTRSNVSSRTRACTPLAPFR